MRLLCSGTILKTPTTRTTKLGDPMTYAAIRDDSSQPVAWVNVTAFGQQAETLAKLKPGDSISVSGKVEITLYQAEGKAPRPNIDVTADQITTLKQRRTAPIPEPAPPKEKPTARQQGDRNEAEAKKAVADMVRKQATTKEAPTTGNCQQCGQPLGADGLCLQCPF